MCVCVCVCVVGGVQVHLVRVCTLNTQYLVCLNPPQTQRQQMERAGSRGTQPLAVVLPVRFLELASLGKMCSCVASKVSRACFAWQNVALYSIQEALSLLLNFLEAQPQCKHLRQRLLTTVILM